MPFKLEEVTSAADFDAIWPVHFQAFRSPYNPFSRFFNPVHTTLNEAIAVSKARHVMMWEASPSCHWIKVTETETIQVVGAACWDVMDKGYVEGDARKFRDTFIASQHIDGSEEKLWAEKLIGGLRSAVMENVKEAHVELKQMVVHPDYRGQGVAKMLTKWGTDIADQRGVKSVVVAVPYARPVYERLGFEVKEQINTEFFISEPSEKWKQWQAENMTAFLMIRAPQKAE